MTTTDTAPEPTENAFAAPEANLTDTSLEKSVLQFERFSAWWVFGLSIITLGIYTIYWLYTRSQIANSLSRTSKVNMTLMSLFIAIYILSLTLGILTAVKPLNGILGYVYGVLDLIYYIMHLIMVLNIRKVIKEIINTGSYEEMNLVGIFSAILAFIFSAIYFQYKINEAIDKQSEKASSIVE